MATWYTVLYRDLDKSEGYVRVGEIRQHNPQQAVRAIVEQNSLQSGSYLAIPTRSFVEVPVTVTQETRIEIGKPAKSAPVDIAV